MNLWDRVGKAFRDNAKKYKTPIFATSSAAVEKDTSYCRLWLVEMRLAKGVDWFQDRYPVVYSAVRYIYGGEPVTVPYIAGREYFQTLTDRNVDRVVQINRPLTPLFPFKGGLVELEAGLFSMRASDPIGKFIAALERLTS